MWFTATATELIRERRAGRRRRRRPPGPGAAGPRAPRRGARGRRVLREPRVAWPLPALARPRSTPGPPRARRARRCGSPRPSAARWASPATTTRSGSPAPSAAAATAPTAVFPHIWDRAKPGIVAVNADGPPVRRRVGVLPPLRPRHVRRAGGARVARDRRRGAAPLRAGHGPPAHPPSGSTSRRGTCTAGRPCASWPRRSASTPTASPPPSPPPTGPPSPVWTRSSARGAACSATSTAIPEHRPNVNLGPIATAPFYAIAVVPTPLGTALGLRTDAVGPGARRGGRADPRPVRVRQRRPVGDGLRVPRRRLPGRGRAHLRLRRRPARGRSDVRPSASMTSATDRGDLGEPPTRPCPARPWSSRSSATRSPR